LTPEQTADQELVLANIRSSLLDIETIGGWETNPDRYSSTATNAVFVIMSRNFAPRGERLKLATTRERRMPKMFEAARANLKNPPRIYTEIALEQLPGIVSFFQKDVPLAFSGLKDRALLDPFHEAKPTVIRELERCEAFPKNDLLPRSKGDFRIGAEDYTRWSIFRGTGCCGSAAKICGRIKRRSARPQRRSTCTGLRNRFWMPRKRIIRRRTSCWRLFAARWVGRGHILGHIGL